MADLSTIARPYAKAAFELARDSGDYAGWGQALSALAGLVADPAMAALVRHPRLTRADLAQVVGDALARSGAAAPAVAFARLLIDNGRVLAIGAIAAQYEALRAEAEARIDVEITSAVDVQDAQRAQLSSAIAQRLARQITVTWHTDPELIAGAVIRAGDTVIDGSVRGQLQGLGAALAR